MYSKYALGKSPQEMTKSTSRAISRTAELYNDSTITSLMARTRIVRFSGAASHQ
jgi:hypothetical protein